MAKYDGLTRNEWSGTWSPSSNHPIALDTELRGGLRYVEGVGEDSALAITGQRLNEGMVIYVGNTHGAFNGGDYYQYNLLGGEARDSNTGEMPNAGGNWTRIHMPAQPLDSANSPTFAGLTLSSLNVDSINIDGSTITGLSDPSGNSHATNKQYVDGAISTAVAAGNNLIISDGVDSDLVDLNGDTLTFTGTNPVQTSVTNNEVAISVDDASTSAKGIASFDSANFETTTGFVGIKAGGVSNTELANSSLTIGSTEVALGAASTVLAGLTSVVADSANISQFTADSAKITTLTTTTGVISQFTADSASITNLNSTTANIAQFTADSAHITDFSTNRLNVDSARAGFIQFNVGEYDDNARPATTEGAVYYNSGPDTLVFKSSSGSPIKIGQEEVTRVYNNTITTLPKGKAVYVTGAANDFPTIALSRGDVFDTVYKTLGVTKDDILPSTYGLVINRGLFGGIDTSAFSAGDILHVSPDSAGEYVNTNPVYPNYALQIGTVLVSDSAGGPGVGGCLQIEVFREIFETIRVTGNSRFDQNLTIGGNLNILGVETRTSVSNLAVADTFLYLGAGDTIGTANTNFAGTGDQNAVLKGHYTGDSNVTFHVRVDTNAASSDIIEWSLDSTYSTLEPFDSAGGPTQHDLADGLTVNLNYNVSIAFDAADGHDIDDSWNGNASPINVQIGFAGNYNEDDAPYAHSGIFRDISDGRWKFFEGYVPEPAGSINTSDASYSYADIQGKQIYGTRIEATAGLIGNVTGTVSDISNHTTTNLNEGNNLYYTNLRADSAARSALIGGTGLNYDSATGKVSITDTTVTAGIYGSASLVPVFTVNAQGQLDSAGTVSVAGVTSLTFDSSDGQLTIGTADGASFIQTLTLDPYTTTDLTEGNNLYYTQARFDSALSDKSTANLSEGSNLYYTQARFDSALGDKSTTDVSEGTNLYYTDARVRSAIGVSGDLSYDSSTGILSVDVEQVYSKSNFDSDLGDASTTDLPEGANLYYTDSRADARITASNTDALSEGSANLYYTQGRFNTAFTGKSTTDLSEGNNLYYTDSRFGTAFGSKSTTDLSEGNKLFYTQTRFNTAFTGKSTTDLSEGSNLYYTQARVDSDIGAGFLAKSTTDVSEGTNLYYTESRVDSNIDASFIAKSTTNLSEGSNLYYTQARFDSALGDKSTTNVSEGTNLYHTTARVNTAFDVRFDSSFDERLTTKTTADLAENTNLYYTEVRADARVDAGFSAKSTTDLSEGSNLYYTDARVDSRLSGGLVGDIEMTGTLKGPSSFIIDPAVHGANSGKVIIKGDFQVDGIQTILNSTTLTVNDKNIVLADSSPDAATSDGAGITVAGANATIQYASTGDKWAFNKPIDVSGSITGTSAIITGLADIDKMDADSSSMRQLNIEAADSAGEMIGKNGIIHRTYHGRTGGDSTSEVVNVYVRTSGKSAAHRFYQIGSGAAYWLSYNAADVNTGREIQAPHIDLTPGVRYKFDTSNSSNDHHDVRFFYSNNKAGGWLTDSSQGVDIVYNGTAGTAGAYSSILVHDGGPHTIAYQCINHSYMGNHMGTNSAGLSRIYQTDSAIGIVGNLDATLDGGTF